MSLSKKLTVIEQKLNLPEKAIRNVNDFLSKLRQSDIITATLLARRTNIKVETAEDVLSELVNAGILDYFIIVACTNPETDRFEDAEHYKQFHSISELNEFSKGGLCPLCECGYTYDIKHSRVGFRLNKNAEI